ncbi:hypothetical protein G7Y89_g15171 [Cudoniella acicularis]|uniref:Heterokaryon incompatibility domain-containing protein n=1 Tax=Cudoniella acicularis TaxID=354080 RepID=A0A8H4QSU6_9HELO|nr:hypothetical protein G7Y89_g15171 [Cudoniella acicularis]
MVRSTAKPAQPSQPKSPQKSKAGVRKKRCCRAKSSRVSKLTSPCTYRYEPLQHADSIRLLALYPGDFTTPIQISLAEVRSQDNHPYEALSYTWAMEDGNCRRSSQIRCDGSKIWVTKNCELALRYLRKKDLNRVLWVDAICINQKDNKERGHQVGLMRNVYSKATGVLIWLGEASPVLGTPLPDEYSADAKTLDSDSVLVPQMTPSGTSDFKSAGQKINNDEGQKGFEVTHSVSEIFLKFFKRMAAETRFLKSIGKDPTSSPLFQELLWKVSAPYLSEFENDLYLGYRDIVVRRWWSRIWVVQEVVVAKSATLLCSRQTMNYNDFFDWYRLLCNSSLDLRTTMVLNSLDIAEHHLCAVTIAWKMDNNLGPPLFLGTLSRFRHLTASNPLDNIFGVLGLSDEIKSFIPVPDYNKTVTEVYTDVAKCFLIQSKSLDILTEAASTTLVLNHPSWVPYWSNPKVIYNPIGGVFKTARNSEAIFAVSSDNQELRVKGRMFDRIQKLQLADLRAYANKSYFEHRIKGWRASCDMGFSLPNYPTGEAVEEALWRTLCWNSDSQNRYPASEKIGESFREWYRILTSNVTVDNIERLMRTETNSFPHGALISTSPLCTTANGYLAAVPYTAEVGDCITILAGRDHPFVLRPTRDHYRLVGPCYVHGIMNGEAFPDNLDELEWFSIR